MKLLTLLTLWLLALLGWLAHEVTRWRHDARIIRHARQHGLTYAQAERALTHTHEEIGR